MFIVAATKTVSFFNILYKFLEIIQTSNNIDQYLIERNTININIYSKTIVEFC